MSTNQSRKFDEKLKEIKKDIESAYEYSRKNYERFWEFQRFVYETTLSNDDEAKLDRLQKPVIEFNIIPAHIARLQGEFSKHEPEVTAMAADGVMVENLTPEFTKQIEVIDGHLRHIFCRVFNDALGYNTYSEALVGGFSAWYIHTDYINDMSFDQEIKWERVFDPTLVGFDILCRDSHKGDGRFCFQLFPMTKEEFDDEYGKDVASKLKFTRGATSMLGTGMAGFNWSYETQQKEIVLVADYYCKRKRKEKIVKLANGFVIAKKQYNKLIESWNAQGFIEQAPAIVDERETIIVGIDRYVICENEVLSFEETNYKYLPIVFVEGKSVTLRQTMNGASYQMTIPYPYHAKGIQQLKNFAGQTVAAEIENMVMHKFIVSAEAIPEDYVDAYKNVQQASTLVYNAFYQKDPKIPLEPPREIQRTMTPPIVESTFLGTDQVTQTILGSYDSILATNEKQISGIAIQQGALQSNAAAIPYLMGYIKALNRVGQIIVDLIPKYYTTPRNLPVQSSDGKRDMQVINHPEHPQSISLNYNPNDLQVKIEAGASASVQKQVTIDQIERMMGRSEKYADFINSKCLKIIVGNQELRHQEQMELKAEEYMQEQEEMKKQAMANPQPDPAMIQAQIQQQEVQAYHDVEMKKLQAQQMKTEGDMAIAAAKIATAKEELELKFMEIMGKLQVESVKINVDREKAASNEASNAVGHAIKIAEAQAKHINATEKVGSAS
jgi:hypothetical protein